MWGRCGRVHGVSVEIVLKWGKVCWDAERYGDVGGPQTLLHLLHTSPHTLHTHPTLISSLTQHLPHSPDTSLYSFPHSPPTSPHSLTLPHTPHIFPHTFPHFYPHSPHLTPFLHLPQHFPTLTPILPHNPHASSNTFPYFIIYPIPNFLTFSFIAKLVQ